MLANIIKSEQLDEQVEVDWAKFVGIENYENDMRDFMTYLVRAEDIVRVLPHITKQEAIEMVYEADVENRGGITFSDFIDTITTVWDSELSAEHINQHEEKDIAEDYHKYHASIKPAEFKPISSLVKREKAGGAVPNNKKNENEYMLDEHNDKNVGNVNNVNKQSEIVADMESIIIV